MNRGYIKFWRKAQDSSSWNRGLMYQGLIINLLSRAAWKKGSYQGRDILPGQFGAVMSHLAESLGVPRSTLQRMVAHLETDDFLKIENMGNRFVVITIVNWGIYQESERVAWAADGQSTVNQRAADGQPSYKEEEVKKEEKTLSTQESLVNQNHARALNVAEGETGEDFSAEQFQSGTGDEPCIEFVELREFWDRECKAEGPLSGWAEYKQLKAARQWPGMGRIAQDVAERYATGSWEKGFAKALGNYLRERYWLAEVKAGPKKQPRASPRAPTEHQRRLTEREERAQRLLEQRGLKPQGGNHEHAGHHCGQVVDVEHRVRDVAL